MWETVSGINSRPQFWATEKDQHFRPLIPIARSRLRATKCDPVAKLWGVARNRYNHNVQNIGSTMNQRLLIGYEPTLICCGSDILKIATVSLFCNTAIWSNFFGNEGQLRPPINLSGHEDSPGTIQYMPYTYKKSSKSRLSDPFFCC